MYVLYTEATMAAKSNKDRSLDVICQHKSNRTIIPLKIRLRDDDGEFQTYVIRSVKDLTTYGGYTMPNGFPCAMNHIYTFDCKIIVFDSERLIRLMYNATDNEWRVM